MNQKESNTIIINDQKYTSEEVAKLVGEKNFPKRSDWEQKIFLFLQDWWNDNDCIEQKTSGSTGAAKQINLTKKAMLASAKRTCEFFDLSYKSRAVLCLSAEYIAGKMMLVRAIASGLNLIAVAPEGNPYKELEGQIDFIAMVPLQAENMFSAIEGNDSKANIRTILLGGAQVSSRLEELISLQEGTDFYIGYGMTETCSHVALKKLAGGDDFYTSMQGVKIALDDRGCVVVDDQEVADERLITNDLAELDSENPSRFKWLGRYDNVINSGGIKFSPEELEQKVAHLLDKPFIFSSLPDERLGEKIILVIETDNSENVFLKDQEKDQLLESLTESLSKFALPKEILLVSELKKTANGKINRLATYDVE